MKKLILIIGTLLVVNSAWAGVMAPLQNSLLPIHVVLREVAKNTHFGQSVESVQNICEKGVQVTFGSGISEIYEVEVSMDPVGTIIDAHAFLNQNVCDDPNSKGGLCCSGLPANAGGCDPGC